MLQQSTEHLYRVLKADINDWMSAHIDTSLFSPQVNKEKVKKLRKRSTIWNQGFLYF